MQTKIELAKPRDFGEIISDTFAFIRQNFKPLIKYFFIFCGIFLLAMAAINIMLQVRVFDVVTNANTGNFGATGPFDNLFSLLPEYLLLIVIIILLSTSITVTVLCFAALYKEKQNNVPTTEEMWGYIKYYFLRVLGASIVTGLLVGVGMVFCFIPGIYLYPIMALVPSIMVIENASFGYAFGQSFRLIRDNWWLTFGALIVVFLILYVANLVVAVPSTILGAGSVFLHLFKGTSAVSVPIAIITTIIQSFAYIFQILMVVAANLCYFNLAETKEGTSLLGRIDQFGTQQAAQDQAPEEY
ncbi:MAG TPA: hypothetical protein VHS53_10385 [Mucilaginibacter sp.]|jgi:hypothetical protein|nr:hypothetical protein [Mucilaginibacter sp.]